MGAGGAAAADAVPVASGATEAGDAEFQPPSDHEGIVSMGSRARGALFDFIQHLTAVAAGATLPTEEVPAAARTESLMGRNDARESKLGKTLISTPCRITTHPTA